MRCIDCVWYDNGTCLKLNVRILFPMRNRGCPYYNKVPLLAKRYLESLSKTTDISQEDIKNSKSFKNLLYQLRDTKV